jgi:hypothetical protein
VGNLKLGDEAGLQKYDAYYHNYNFISNQQHLLSLYPMSFVHGGSIMVGFDPFGNLLPSYRGPNRGMHHKLYPPSRQHDAMLMDIWHRHPISLLNSSGRYKNVGPTYKSCSSPTLPQQMARNREYTQGTRYSMTKHPGLARKSTTNGRICLETILAIF